VFLIYPFVKISLDCMEMIEMLLLGLWVLFFDEDLTLMISLLKL